MQLTAVISINGLSLRSLLMHLPALQVVCDLYALALFRLVHCALTCKCTDATSRVSSPGRPPTWVLDKDAVSCKSCKKSFGIFLPRHHCRYQLRIVINCYLTSFIAGNVVRSSVTVVQNQGSH